jgi:hypothetical protein
MVKRSCRGETFLSLAIAAAAMSGCDQINQAVVQPAVEEATEATMSNDLAAVGLAYHDHHDVHSQGPAGWDEFITFAEGSESLDANAIRRVRDAGYQMQWNVRFRDVTAGLSNTVLAENTSGGPKLMLDGSVQ